LVITLGCGGYRYLNLLGYFNRAVTAKQKNYGKSDDDSQTRRATSTLETQSVAPRPNATILGFTATFSRHDQLALSSVFEEIVYHQDVWDMLQAGWLAPARFTTIKAKIQLAECAVSERTGDFVAKGLSGKVNTEEVNELVVRTWLDRAGE
jgi:ATP-dependent helicase IRC3